MTDPGLAECLASEENLLNFREYCKLQSQLDYHRLSALIFLSIQGNIYTMSSASIHKLHEQFLEPDATKPIGYDARCLILDDVEDLKSWLFQVLAERYGQFKKSDFFRLSAKRQFSHPPLQVRKRGLLRRPHFDRVSDEWFHTHITSK